VSRSARLLDLIQALRRRRRPATAATLAAELGVSERTIYRDIATLSGQGAPIEGEAGLGYVLRPGFLLPPLMFDDDEIEALVLGLRWVAQRADDPLEAAAVNALAKISAVLPPELRERAVDAGVLAGASAAMTSGSVDLSDLRSAIRAERKLRISYTDREGSWSERTIWPIALGYFDKSLILVAWCERRRDFRHFRTDRIVNAGPIDARYPRRRRVLLREWREQERVPEQI
jgi:predicted DNA-binding transcriptional regulator YafY